MDAILHVYFYDRIDQIQESSQSASTGGVMSAEDVESVDVNKEIFEVLNTSFEIKAQPALLENNDLINTTQNKMETLFQHIITLEAQEKDKKFDDIMALAITYFNMGLIYSELQKLDIGEAHFTTCMELLKEKELERKAIMTVIKVLHELHNISYKCEQPEKSCSFLYTAMELYSRYTKEEIEYPDPINFNALLGKLFGQADNEEDSNSKIALENLQLTTLINMSVLYEEHPRDKHKFAIYVHNILKQIEMEEFSVHYAAEWIITSSHLSQYFVHNYRFTEARNYLIAAEYLIKEYCQIIKDTELINKKHKSYSNTVLLKMHEYGCNIVTKFWMLYGAELLIASADGLLPKEENNKSYETDNSKSESVVGSEGTFTNLLIISTIKEKELENFIQFPDKCVSNFNDAKVIFMDVLKYFYKAQKYFTVEEYFVDHMEIIMTISKVLNGLATFAQDKDMKCSLHYWRKKILSDFGKLEVVESVLKTCSASIRFQFETMILNEVIEVFTTLLNIKTEHLLLNVEQLNRDFTEDLKTNHINPLVEKLIFSFGFTTRNIDKNLNY